MVELLRTEPIKSLPGLAGADHRIFQAIFQRLITLEVVDLMNGSQKIENMVGIILEQLVQESFLEDQATSHPVKLLKWSQVLEPRVSQVDHYIAKRYLELITSPQSIH